MWQTLCRDTIKIKKKKCRGRYYYLPSDGKILSSWQLFRSAKCKNIYVLKLNKDKNQTILRLQYITFSSFQLKKSFYLAFMLCHHPREPEGRARASRARAVTVSQCPHSEVGQDFLLRRRVTLTETIVTRKRKV